MCKLLNGLRDSGKRRIRMLAALFANWQSSWGLFLLVKRKNDEIYLVKNVGELYSNGVLGLSLRQAAATMVSEYRNLAVRIIP